jgi:hypothetical protein
MSPLTSRFLLPLAQTTPPTPACPVRKRSALAMPALTLRQRELKAKTLERITRATLLVEQVWGAQFRQDLAERGIQVPRPETISKHFIERLSSLARDYTLEGFVSAVTPHVAERRNPGQALDNGFLDPQQPRTLQVRDLALLIEARQESTATAPPAKRQRPSLPRSPTPPSPETARRSAREDLAESGVESDVESRAAQPTDLLSHPSRRSSFASHRSRCSLASVEYPSELVFYDDEPTEPVQPFSNGCRVSVASDPVASDPVHSDPVHSDPVHSDTVHSDTVHSDPIHGDAVLVARSAAGPTLSPCLPEPLHSDMTGGTSKDGQPGLTPTINHFAKQFDANITKHNLCRHKVFAIETQIVELEAPKAIHTAGLDQLDRVARQQRIAELHAAENELEEQIKEKGVELNSIKCEEKERRQTMEEDRREVSNAIDLLQIKLAQINEALGRGGGGQVEDGSETTP